jgi:hypothetical protein
LTFLEKEAKAISHKPGAFDRAIKCGLSLAIYDKNGRVRMVDMVPYTIYFADHGAWMTERNPSEVIKQVELD